MQIYAKGFGFKTEIGKGFGEKIEKRKQIS
jgi:hypothetical protein